jgi:small basic protein
MQTKGQYEWGRRVNSLNYSVTRNDKLRDALIALDHEFGSLDAGKNESISLDIINAAIDKNPKIYRDILMLLGHWENMALAIHCSVADEDIAFEMVAGIVITHVRRFRNFIDFRREKNRKSYLYLLNLFAVWDQRKNGAQMAHFEFLPLDCRTDIT